MFLNIPAKRTRVRTKNRRFINFFVFFFFQKRSKPTIPLTRNKELISDGLSYFLPECVLQIFLLTAHAYTVNQLYLAARKFGVWVKVGLFGALKFGFLRVM